MKRKITLIVIVCLFGMAKLTKSQEVKINTNLVVESDGTVRMENNATVWDDLMVFPDATTKFGSKVPEYVKFKDNGSSSQGVGLNMFSDSNEEELYFTVQIPHSYKIGTDLHPHVHWTTATVAPNGSNVVWGLEYTIQPIGGTFGNTTIIYATTSISTPVGPSQHLINSFSTIPGTNIGISTILVCRLFRAVSHTGDTFANDVGLLGFDIHFEQDTFGSRLEYTK